VDRPEQVRHGDRPSVRRTDDISPSPYQQQQSHTLPRRASEATTSDPIQVAARVGRDLDDVLCRVLADVGSVIPEINRDLTFALHRVLRGARSLTYRLALDFTADFGLAEWNAQSAGAHDLELLSEVLHRVTTDFIGADPALCGPGWCLFGGRAVVGRHTTATHTVAGGVHVKVIATELPNPRIGGHSRRSATETDDVMSAINPHRSSSSRRENPVV